MQSSPFIDIFENIFFFLQNKIVKGILLSQILNLIQIVLYSDNKGLIY